MPGRTTQRLRHAHLPPTCSSGPSFGSGRSAPARSSASGICAKSLAWEGSEPRPAACNLGTRPTVGGTKHVVEAHVFNFDGDLYDRAARLLFIQRLRDELRFPSLEALRSQIAADVAQTAARVRERVEP